MCLALHIGYGLYLLLAIPTAGFLVRLFMIQHDCGHGSFFRHFEDSEQHLDIRLDALKLARKFAAAKVTPRTIRTQREETDRLSANSPRTGGFRARILSLRSIDWIYRALSAPLSLPRKIAFPDCEGLALQASHAALTIRVASRFPAAFGGARAYFLCPGANCGRPRRPMVARRIFNHRWVAVAT
jgi:hypothetical protein